MAGIDGIPIRVEADVSGGLPGLEIVGLADAAVRESRHRVRAALRNSGFQVPARKITVNLAPADLQKEGSQIDLAVAAGILAASDQMDRGERLSGYLLLGELALDGSLRPVRGVLPMVLSARKTARGAVIPRENGGEVSFLEGFDVHLASTLVEAASFLRGATELPLARTASITLPHRVDPGVDTADIRGQSVAKRALEVAASGGHNILMTGPPGVGKSMLAKAIPGILPDLSPEEALEVTRIQSVAGVLSPGAGLVRQRPFRAPHHTVTSTALIGGGATPRPGEITLAHRGVLFLDELPEFPPSVLNALRQPIEDGFAVVTRSRGTHKFPSRFVLIGGMNACQCGFFGDDSRECTCTTQARRNYVSRVSGPFLDRMDICLSVSRVAVEDLSGPPGEASAQVKERVCVARLRQAERFRGTGLFANAEMGPRELNSLISFSGKARKVAFDAVQKMGLSTRGYYRVLKVAATVADLEDSPRVEEEHVAEALSYRQTVAEGD